jgi:hypothetical protein
MCAVLLRDVAGGSDDSPVRAFTINVQAIEHEDIGMDVETEESFGFLSITPTRGEYPPREPLRDGELPHVPWSREEVGMAHVSTLQIFLEPCHLPLMTNDVPEHGGKVYNTCVSRALN